MEAVAEQAAQMPSVVISPAMSDSDVLAAVLAVPGENYRLVIEADTFNPPLVYRRCLTNPTADQAELIAKFAAFAASGLGRRFSGQRVADCDYSFYLGWNATGKGFEYPACYCQKCGYSFSTVKKACEVQIQTARVSPKSIAFVLRVCIELEIPVDLL